MDTFRKTFKCQTGAKKYGLKDIELELDKNINFLCYGIPFAEKITYGNGVYDYVTYFKEDKRKATFEDTLAYKLLMDPNIYTPCYSTEKNIDEFGEEIIEKYKLIYFNPECSIMKPTVLYTYNPDKEKCAKIVCEYLFVFQEEWLFSHEEVLEVTNLGISPYDYILSSLKDLGEFKKGKNFFLSNSSACTIHEIDKEPIISLEVCNLKGEFNTLDFTINQWKNIINSFCSVRIVEVKEPDSNYQNLNIMT